MDDFQDKIHKFLVEYVAGACKENGGAISFDQIMSLIGSLNYETYLLYELVKDYEEKYSESLNENVNQEND